MARKPVVSSSVIISFSVSGRRTVTSRQPSEDSDCSTYGSRAANPPRSSQTTDSICQVLRPRTLLSKSRSIAASAARILPSRSATKTAEPARALNPAATSRPASDASPPRASTDALNRCWTGFPRAPLFHVPLAVIAVGGVEVTARNAAEGFARPISKRPRQLYAGGRISNLTSGTTDFTISARSAMVRAAP